MEREHSGLTEKEYFCRYPDLLLPFLLLLRPIEHLLDGRKVPIQFAGNSWGAV